jgi:hypothetical protein
MRYTGGLILERREVTFSMDDRKIGKYLTFAFAAWAAWLAWKACSD